MLKRKAQEAVGGCLTRCRRRQRQRDSLPAQKEKDDAVDTCAILTYENVEAPMPKRMMTMPVRRPGEETKAWLSRRMDAERKRDLEHETLKKSFVDSMHVALAPHGLPVEIINLVIVYGCWPVWRVRLQQGKVIANFVSYAGHRTNGYVYESGGDYGKRHSYGFTAFCNVYPVVGADANRPSGNTNQLKLMIYPFNDSEAWNDRRSITHGVDQLLFVIHQLFGTREEQDAAYLLPVTVQAFSCAAIHPNIHSRRRITAPTVEDYLHQPLHADDDRLGYACGVQWDVRTPRYEFLLRESRHLMIRKCEHMRPDVDFYCTHDQLCLAQRSTVQSTRDPNAFLMLDGASNGIHFIALPLSLS